MPGLPPLSADAPTTSAADYTFLAGNFTLPRPAIDIRFLPLRSPSQLVQQQSQSHIPAALLAVADAEGVHLYTVKGELAYSHEISGVELMRAHQSETLKPHTFLTVVFAYAFLTMITRLCLFDTEA